MKNTVRFDWAMKRLLRNKANFGILEGFLSELLQEDIVIDSILESESNKQTADNKYNRVDLLVQNSKGELIIIEVQSDYMRDYLLRMLFGTAKLVVDNMDEGMLYGKLKKIISVNIVYFDLGHGEDYIYYGGTNFTGLNKKDVLRLSHQEEQIYHTPNIARIYPEYYIIRVNKFNEIAKNTLDEWISFLKNEEVKEGSKAKGLSEAKERLDVLKLSAEERRDYDIYIDNWRISESVAISNYEAGEYTGRKEGLETGIKIGEEKGLKVGEEKGLKIGEEKLRQKQLEIAGNCLRSGMSVAQAASLTGLSEAEIRLAFPDLSSNK